MKYKRKMTAIVKEKESLCFWITGINKRIDLTTSYSQLFLGVMLTSLNQEKAEKKMLQSPLSSLEGLRYDLHHF